MILIRSFIIATALFVAFFIGAHSIAPKVSSYWWFDWALLLACALSPLLWTDLRSKPVMVTAPFTIGLGVFFFILAFIIMAKVFHEGL